MLFTIKKVLVCYDILRSHNEFFLEEVKKIQQRLRCEVEFLFVQDQLTQPYHDENEHLIHKIKSVGEVHLLRGKVSKLMLEHLNQHTYDLIIIGAHDEQRDFLFWHHDIADQIFIHSRDPILVLTKKISFDHLYFLFYGSFISDWMIVSAFDFLRIFQFKKLIFVHFTSTPLRSQNDINNHTSQLFDHISQFQRKGEEINIQVFPLSNDNISHFLKNSFSSPHTSFMLLKRCHTLRSGHWSFESHFKETIDFKMGNFIVL